jgi:hypothetical protein
MLLKEGMIVCQQCFATTLRDNKQLLQQVLPKLLLAPRVQVDSVQQNENIRGRSCDKNAKKNMKKNMEPLLQEEMLKLQQEADRNAQVFLHQ